MSKAIMDLTGQKFGLLSVVDRAENDKFGKTQWLCCCDCGSRKVIAGASLKRGLTNSCGCIRKQVMKKRQTKHGFSKKERLYGIWLGIKSRCLNKNEPAYKGYGGRGITICDEWLNDYLAFRNWSLANGYKNNITIDRKDNNGNYEPSNCRWTTQKIQANNTRTNHLITLDGKTRTLSEWSEDVGIKRETIAMRLRLGWSNKEALSIKPKYGSKIQCIRNEATTNA